MKIKENLTVREAIKYAKDNGFDKEMFSLKINNEYIISGKFLDAYYEMIQIPLLGNGFTRFKEFCEQYGERNISIDIIDEQEFKTCVSMDFIIRGKFNDIPEEYKLT